MLLNNHTSTQKYFEILRSMLRSLLKSLKSTLCQVFKSLEKAEYKDKNGYLPELVKPILDKLFGLAVIEAELTLKKVHYS